MSVQFYDPTTLSLGKSSEDRRLGGPQSWFGCRRDERNFFTLPVNWKQCQEQICVFGPCAQWKWKNVIYSVNKPTAEIYSPYVSIRFCQKPNMQQVVKKIVYNMKSFYVSLQWIFKEINWEADSGLQVKLHLNKFSSLNSYFVNEVFIVIYSVPFITTRTIYNFKKILCLNHSERVKIPYKRHVSYPWNAFGIVIIIVGVWIWYCCKNILNMYYFHIAHCCTCRLWFTCFITVPVIFEPLAGIRRFFWIMNWNVHLILFNANTLMT
jgi:hypothetical protein